MRVTGNGCHLIGTEGSSPPLPYIEVSEGTGNALIRQKLAVEFTGPDAEPKKAPKKAAEPKKAPEPVKEPEPAKEPEKKPEAEGEGEDRAETILHALDLVEGEPTAEAIAEITGLADVTAEEIAEAVKAKEAAEA
jgi:hypothetical protein